MNRFDSHFHIIDPRFPLTPNAGFLPDAYTCADYHERAEALGVVGGAVVSGSFQGVDQAYLVDALRRLGPTFVGVTQLPAGVSDAEILRLHTAGVRAVRFNLRRGGSVSPADLEAFAHRVHALAGWHVELYADARQLDQWRGRLARLPQVVIDHMGLSRAALPVLRQLVGQGACVKASGFGRLDFDPAPVLRELIAINPRAVLFGTDLPGTRAPRPFVAEDIDRLVTAVGAEHACRVLHDNAVKLYRPAAVAGCYH